MLQPGWFWAIDIAYFVGMPVFLILACVRKGFSVQEIFFAPIGTGEWQEVAGSRFAMVLVALMAAGACYWLLTVPLRFTRGLNEFLPAQFNHQDFKNRAEFASIAAVYFALSAALLEELVYRWLLGKALLDRGWGAAPFLCISTALFGLIHWHGGLQAIVLTGLVGLLLSWVYLKIRLLWPLVVAHATIDLLVYL